jgi:hypothetical protein
MYLKAATSSEKRKVVFANESYIDPPGGEPNRYVPPSQLVAAQQM